MLGEVPVILEALVLMDKLVGEVLEAQLAVLLELVEQVLLVLPSLEDLVVVVEALVVGLLQMSMLIGIA